LPQEKFLEKKKFGKKNLLRNSSGRSQNALGECFWGFFLKFGIISEKAHDLFFGLIQTLYVMKRHEKYLESIALERIYF